MAVRFGTSVVGYSWAVSKIGHEPHFRLRSADLGSRWIHAFAAVAVSKSFDFRVFNEEHGVGSAKWDVQWPGFLVFNGRDAPRRQSLGRRTPDCLVSCFCRLTRSRPAS